MKAGSQGNLEGAVALYLGDLLEGFDDEWVVNERYRLRELFLDALAQLIALYEQAGDHRQALTTAQRLLERDPLREDAHRAVMRAYHAMGQRNAALEQYRRCVKIIENELGVEPAPETVQLYKAVAGLEARPTEAAVRGYELCECIGQGGFGAVFRLANPQNRNRIA